MYDVMRYIHSHIREKLDLSTLASLFGYSKWHFCVKFHEYSGSTVTEYIRHYRMQMAAIDILSGGKVTDVALDCGYDSVSGFARAFITEFGCFPREYRRKAKEAQLYYERRNGTMYSLTDRCNHLREEAVNIKSVSDSICLERIVYFTLGRARAKRSNMPENVVMARGIASVIENFTPHILPHEIIVGFNFGDKTGRGDAYVPSNNVPDDYETTRELFEKNNISEDDAREFFENVGIIRENEGAVFMDGHTKAQKEAEDEWAVLGRCVDGNHSVIGYEEVIKYGFAGLSKRIDEYEAKNGKSPFYDSVRIVCDAARTIGRKYADHARELLNSSDGEYEREDLEKIIEICERVPEYPARTFAEAIQALFFAHIINTYEDNINANSLGRLDQMLYPYYKADIEKGILTKEEAYELVCLLWIKLYRDYDVQQSCVGGTDTDGNDMVNELSYMMLDATEALDFVRCLSVRFTKNTDKEFVKRALEVVGHLQKGVPFFFNDEVMTKALIGAGIEKKDAYDYTQIGCVETVIPGKSNPHAVTGETNFLKAIEYVLCNGHSMMYPEYEPGIKTGELSSFDTYEKFYAAILVQIENILDLVCDAVKKSRERSVYLTPKPYKSLLTLGCVESGHDFNDAGAKYDYYQIMFCGIPNLADSLAVIKKFVYDEKKYTLSELKDILVADFPDETVRLEFMNKAPKFGNDIESVDKIAYDITNKGCDMLEKLCVKYSLSFHAQPFTYLWMVGHGERTAATPDGRRKGEILAYSVSPMQGRDFNGLTALLNSIAGFPTTRTPGTTSAIVEVDPKLFTDANIGILADTLISAAERGISNVQFNTVDADTLIDAREHPERHRNLAVRVSGFSQKFELLTPELQDHIIHRTKHASL